MQGESLLDPAVTQRVLERIKTGKKNDDELALLSEQERKLFEGKELREQHPQQAQLASTFRSGGVHRQATPSGLATPTPASAVCPSRRGLLGLGSMRRQT